MRLLISVFSALTIIGAQPGFAPRLQQQPGTVAVTTTTDPAFEVVSIHPSPPNSTATSVSVPQGARVRETGITLLQLVAFAYGVKQNQITAPAWVSSQTYNVDAKTEGDVPLNLQQMQPLLQRLLADRFSLKVHHETQLTSGYELVVDKTGLKLHPATAQDEKSIYFQPNGIRGNCSLSAIAAVLEGPAGKPVADKTNLAGDYRFQLNYSADNDADSPLPSFFTAVREQLGIRLIPARVPVDQLVIDHANREPTAN
jgi:uncharacterized protein (TIGR03435 family)